MAQEKHQIVSAADVASWSFFPESLRLTEEGHAPTYSRSLHLGKAHHEVLKHVERSSSRGFGLGATLLLAAPLLALGLAGQRLR